MTVMYKLSNGQAKQCEKKMFDEDSYFNPVQDINGDWFISEQEVEQCTAAGFEWVKSLRPAPYVPKPSPPFPGLS